MAGLGRHYRRWLVVAAGVMLAGVGGYVPVAWLCHSGRDTLQRSYVRVRIGMTAEQVWGIMGPSCDPESDHVEIEIAGHTKSGQPFSAVLNAKGDPVFHPLPPPSAIARSGVESIVIYNEEGVIVFDFEGGKLTHKRYGSRGGGWDWWMRLRDVLGI